MKKFLKSLFGGASSDDAKAPAAGQKTAAGQAPAAGEAPAAGQEPAPEGASAANEAPTTSAAASRGSDLSVEAIAADLVAHIQTTMPDPLPVSEIDLHVHMFDAGYVTSISAADLLAHIETRYGLAISETKLIGPLQNVHALATFIQSPTS